MLWCLQSSRAANSPIPGDLAVASHPRVQTRLLLEWMEQVLLLITFLQCSDEDRNYFCGRCLSYNFPWVDELERLLLWRRRRTRLGQLALRWFRVYIIKNKRIFSWKLWMIRRCNFVRKAFHLFKIMSLVVKCQKMKQSAWSRHGEIIPLASNNFFRCIFKYSADP